VPKRSELQGLANEARQEAMTLLMALQQRQVPKEIRDEIVKAAGLSPDVVEEKFIASVILNGAYQDLNSYQQSVMLAARILCVVLPENLDTTRALRAGLAALLKSSDVQAKAKALEGLVNEARPSAHKHIGNAIRKNRALTKELEDVRTKICSGYLSETPKDWRDALSSCEKLPPKAE
jgi:hypothetical protein